MYILDKNKDYYDYLSHIYGVDKSITYDRRGSIVVSDEQLLGLCVRRFQREREVFGLLEIGYIQYLFEFSNIQYRTEPLSSIETPYKCDSKVIYIFKDNKHYFDKEITFCACDLQRANYFSWKLWRKPLVITSFKENVKLAAGYKIENPILRDTMLVQHIEGLDIWKELSTFISSKYNDKTILIKNTDKDLIVNHGFDVKTSFRYPVKWGI